MAPKLFCGLKKRQKNMMCIIFIFLWGFVRERERRVVSLLGTRALTRARRSAGLAKGTTRSAQRAQVPRVQLPQNAKGDVPWEVSDGGGLHYVFIFSGVSREAVPTYSSACTRFVCRVRRVRRVGRARPFNRHTPNTHAPAPSTRSGCPSVLSKLRVA